MNLLRSLCCLVAGRCSPERAPEPSERREAPVSEGDLGQKEAEVEKTSKEQMSRMGEGSEPGKSA